MSGLTLDAGALIAAERGDRDFRRRLDAAARRSVVTTVPAAVVGQVWRNDRRQARLVRLLAVCEIEILDEGRARAAGELLGRARSTDVVDATVVAGALARGDRVLTSDPADLRRLATAAGRELPLFIV